MVLMIRAIFLQNIYVLNLEKKNKIDNSSIIIGYAGRYAKQKNILSMLSSFSKITKKRQDIYLYMVGRNISLKNKELNLYVNNLKLNKKVFFLNEQKTLLEFYNGIDFLLLTSHSESFPNVIAESMLCSTPVLSSNAGCAKKIINSYGFVMKRNDRETIFKNLKKVTNFFKYNKKSWKTIKKNFSIPNMSDTYLNNWILK